MMKKTVIVLFLLCLLIPIPVFAEEAPSFNLPSLVFVGQKVQLSNIGPFDRIIIDGLDISAQEHTIARTGTIPVVIVKGEQKVETTIYAIPGILTVLPPLMAIIMALLIKDVVISLFVGIFAGALIIFRFNFIKAFFRVVDTYVLDSVADGERASIIIFTLLLGGMVGIITKSGGVKGIVTSLSKKVKSAQSTQFYTWLMGIFIFFDDYSNTLIVGNTMRPLCDKWKVSREKLSYIVDSTAAPMASIAMISTWIGFELTQIKQALENSDIVQDAYYLFISSLPYRFYPILALFFILLLLWMKKDFGPMLKAETRARHGKVMNDNAVPLADFETSSLAPHPDAKIRWYTGLIPIIVVIVFTFGGLYISGKSGLAAAGHLMADRSFFGIVFSRSIVKNLGIILSHSDSYRVLLWASFMGVVSAFIMAKSQKILNIRELVSAFVQGMKSMLMAILILVLAGSLGVVIGQLNTAHYLTSILSSNFDYHFFPLIVFILSAFIAFATGSSWGTIAIMYPLIIPIIVRLTAGTPDFMNALVLTISSVLAGGVFGDHCSPISDTTIMSSMASSCDHIDHVKTQIPYAMIIAIVAMLGGIIPISFGVPYALSILISAAVLTGVVYFLGKHPSEESTS